MNKIQAIIIDIDETLTDKVSWTTLTRDLGGSVDEHNAIYSALVDGHLGLDEARLKLLQLWQNTGNANRSYITQVFRRWSLHDGAHEFIRLLQQRGYRLCLITGSIDLYAEHVATLLGIQDYYANSVLTFDSNGDLVDFSYNPDQAGLKFDQLRDYCGKYSLSYDECVAIGDGMSELELFRATKRGILISENPAEKEDVLVGSAWKVVDSLTATLQFL